jgi:hypothetical protein
LSSRSPLTPRWPRYSSPPEPAKSASTRSLGALLPTTWKVFCVIVCGLRLLKRPILDQLFVGHFFDSQPIDLESIDPRFQNPQGCEGWRVATSCWGGSRPRVGVARPACFFFCFFFSSSEKKSGTGSQDLGTCVNVLGVRRAASDQRLFEGEGRLAVVRREKKA